MKIGRIASLAIALVLFILLFTAGPEDNAPRSLQQFWNLGHIVLFFTLGFLLLNPPSPIAARSFALQCLVLISFTLLLGASIELVQARIGRDMDLADMARNSVGALLSLAFVAPARLSLPGLARHGLQLISVLVLTAACLPFALDLWDEQRALQAWPELASFEHSAALTRWSATGQSKLSVDGTSNPEGRQALRVELGTSAYAGASLDYFPGDWSAYQQLVMTIFNPRSSPLKITCRIHDQAHSRAAHQDHSDRFNQSYQLQPGWNRINISMQAVASAPVGRTMDMQHIDNLQLFVSDLASAAVIYIGPVYLAVPLPTKHGKSR